MKPKVGVLLSRVRVEEKLLIQELEKRNADSEILDDRQIVFDIQGNDWRRYDVVLERCVSHSRALYSLLLFRDWGVPTVNTYEVVENCGNKLLTTSHRARACPRRDQDPFTPESAPAAIEEMGYPVVLKPGVGLGPVVIKINDREAAENRLEHKQVLGSYHQSSITIQEYIEKPGRDIRAFVVGDETICAIYRDSSHWITIRPSGVAPMPVTLELHDSAGRCQGIGGGVVALDISRSSRGLLVNEINYTMEFRNASTPRG